jgi:hypothetical protein
MNKKRQVVDIRTFYDSPTQNQIWKWKTSFVFNLPQLLPMNEFFSPFTRSGSSKVTIKNENRKSVFYFLLRASQGLGETKIQ